MIVRPMIGEWEVPRIERVGTVEGRRLARLSVPGLVGDLHHDLGRHSLAVEIVGFVVAGLGASVAAAPFEPDGGSGALEWGLFLGLAAIAIGSAAAAILDWRRAAVAEG